MIAFIDLEYNADSDYTKQRTDYSIVEVGIVIKERFESSVVEKTWGSFVKPEKNDGKIRERITKLTGITQAQIDGGITRKEMYEKVKSLVEEYNITKIYFYGDDDYALRETFSDMPEAKKFFKKYTKSIAYVPKFKEVTAMFADKPSLKMMGFAYELYTAEVHRAVDDALDLADLTHSIYTADINTDNLTVVNKYIKCRNAYTKFKQALNNLTSDELVLDTVYKDLKEGKKFLAFYDYLELSGFDFDDYDEPELYDLGDDEPEFYDLGGWDYAD